MCPEEPEDEIAYHPDIKDKGNGLFCFKDSKRPCGPDCMAYQLERPEGPDYRGQWANCAILTNEFKSAKHLIIIAQGVTQLLKRDQDKARTSQQPPGVVVPSGRAV